MDDCINSFPYNRLDQQMRHVSSSLDDCSFSQTSPATCREGSKSMTENMEASAVCPWDAPAENAPVSVSVCPWDDEPPTTSKPPIAG